MRVVIVATVFTSLTALSIGLGPTLLLVCGYFLVLTLTRARGRAQVAEAAHTLALLQAQLDRAERESEEASARYRDLEIEYSALLGDMLVAGQDAEARIAAARQAEEARVLALYLDDRPAFERTLARFRLSREDDPAARWTERTPWWEILGVTPGAPESAVQQAYHRLCRRFHPDAGLSTSDAAIKKINIAYERYKAGRVAA